jgi:hypothetical protein
MSRGRALLVIVGLVFLAGPEPVSVANRPRAEIVLCGDLVPVGLAQANASFQVFYQVETDSVGKVQRVSKLRNTMLPDAALVACLERWSLPVADAKATVSFRWTHAQGWTQLSISMPGFPTRTVTIDPGWQ